MSELKPCPFCGNKARVWRTNYATFVECVNYSAKSHQVELSAVTEEEAIKAWNTRKGNEDG